MKAKTANTVGIVIVGVFAFVGMLVMKSGYHWWAGWFAVTSGAFLGLLIMWRAVISLNGVSDNSAGDSSQTGPNDERA